MVAGREFLQVLFTARFANSWPIFAVNLTLLPLGIVLLDPLYRAFERERYFLLRLRLALAAALIAALWLFTERAGLLGVIGMVVASAAVERVGWRFISDGCWASPRAIWFCCAISASWRWLRRARAQLRRWSAGCWRRRRSAGPGRMRRCFCRRLFGFGETGHFGGSELAVAADGKIADAQASDFDADQFEHFASDGFQHAAHLPVAAFVQSYFDERIFPGIADAFHSRGLSGAVAERHAIAQLPQLFVAEQRGGLHQIRFGNLVIGIGDRARQSACRW